MLAQDANHSDTDIQNIIFSLISEEIRQLQKMLESLEQEKEALGGHDAEQIEKNTTFKQTALANVERASQKRVDYLRQLGINPFSEGWYEQLIPHFSQPSVLAEQFDQLLSLTNRCRSLNQTNGLLINRRETLTSKVINILRANNTPEIYSDSGQSENRSDTRIIGKA